MDDLHFQVYPASPDSSENPTDIDDSLPANTVGGNPDIEKELTNKFLRGELTFTEYSSEWYGKDNEEEEMDAEEYTEDYPAQQSTPILKEAKRPTMKLPRRKIRRLSPALLGLMGEANLRYVRGDKEVAEKMCHEIIRQVPTASEPYQTLAQIYDSDPEKSLQFSLLAAHLSPSDADEWLRLASMSKQRNDVKQEMLCFTQAIKANPRHLPTHMKRLELLKSLEEINYPLNTLKISFQKCYHKIVTSMPPSEGETVMKYAKMAATLYHRGNEIERALEVMKAAYDKCAGLFTIEDLNLYLELLISQKQYQGCIEALVASAGVEIEADVHMISDDDKIEEQTQYISCHIPSDLPIDLKCKLLVCFIHLGALNLVRKLVDDFLCNDVEKTGDLYIDIEEALTAIGEHTIALRLLEPLIKSNNFSLGAVWLKHAECLLQLGREDEAIESLKLVIKHAPQHADARHKLFKILEDKGCHDEALKALQQDNKLLINTSLMLEQCSVLKKYNQELKFLEVGEALLSKSFMKYRHLQELKLARLTRYVSEAIHNFRVARGENPSNEDDLQFDENESFKISPQQEWELFTDLLAVAFKLKKYLTMQRLSFGAVISKNLSNYRHEIDFFCVQSCLLNNDYLNAFPILRDFAGKFREYPRVWNLLNLVLHATDQTMHNKFLARLFQRNKDTVPLMRLFLGNNYLLSGRYQMALRYFLEYHEQHNEALTSLLVSITILIMACQRTVDKHHSLILQGLTYLLAYKSLRKFDEESYYNLGRAFQMMSLNNLAIHYYEKALSCTTEEVCTKHKFLNLRCEVAFNLHLLYKESSPHMARMYLQKYIVI